MKSGITKPLNFILKPFGLVVSKSYPEVYIHQYESYEHYREIQIRFNKQKIDKVWADEATMDSVAKRVMEEFGESRKIAGICHGTRNGFEQNYLADKYKFETVGTDISETAKNYPRSVQWDFHDINQEWLGKFDFAYTNSLDQSWKPKEALSSWLGQLKIGGLLFIEHTKWHEPQGASEMDPFGAKSEYMPYLLSEWFGHQVSIEIRKGVKSNSNFHLILFTIKRLK